LSKDNCLATTHPQLANQWHPTKNHLTPFDVTRTHNQQIKWVCDKGHEWDQTVRARKRGKHGCPVCRHSKGEQKIELVLISQGVDYRREFRFYNCKHIMTLPFDFVILPLSKQPAVIEYQGEHHYHASAVRKGKSFEDVKFRDQIKFDFCIQKKLPFLVIPYWDQNKVDIIVKKFLSSLSPR
jgi:hypothetical protein